MQPESTSNCSIVKVNTSEARRVRLGQRQRALLGTWQAFSFLMVFIGLVTGMFMTMGAPLLGSLVLVLAVLTPLALTTVTMRMGRYRLSSVFAMLGVLLDVCLVFALLVTPFDGYPLLEQIARVIGSFAAAGLLTGAAAATFDTARALWGASAGPRPLGPSTPAPSSEALIAGTRESAGLGGESPRLLRTMRLVRATY
jgi:hypothetical protein